MTERFSVDTDLARYVLRRLRYPPARVNTTRDLENLYEVRVWFSLNDLDDSIDEILHLIDQLPSRATYVDTMIAVKSYIVSWCTLSDIVAELINRVFDLGIDEKDIDLMMLFRNEHIKASSLPDILKKHAPRVRHDYFSALRNDIVHRGTLKDPDMDSVKDRLPRLKILRLVDPDAVDVEEEAMRVDLQNYQNQKQSDFTRHIQATIALLGEIVVSLQPIVESKIALIESRQENNAKQVRQTKP